MAEDGAPCWKNAKSAGIRARKVRCAPCATGGQMPGFPRRFRSGVACAAPAGSVPCSRTAAAASSRRDGTIRRLISFSLSTCLSARAAVARARSHLPWRKRATAVHDTRSSSRRIGALSPYRHWVYGVSRRNDKKSVQVPTPWQKFLYRCRAAMPTLPRWR